jgi:3-oxoacyl-[acyl-carrier-protein] synthase II
MVCVSSSVAIIQAADLIRRGVCQRVVAGGFEEFSQFVFTGFFCIGALASGPLRPFDEERDGTALGEGAVLLTLETLASAQERGAVIYAELLGGGHAADGVHMTAPDREGRGLERAVRQAFVESGLGPVDVDYLCAHGTGTVFNDAMECQAFGRIFSEVSAAGRMPPISGLKAVFGHTLGAAGALDAVFSILALTRGVLPPTVATRSAIEDWDFVAGAGRSVEGGLNVALSTNSAFGGNNSALIFRRWDGDGARS